MALIRPVVLVFQEVASPTVTPTTPDLNCLVVGPAYHIRDYFSPGTTSYADKTAILLGTVYGALEANVGAATPVGDAYITVADPPDNEVGAVLDADSVVVYFDDATAIIDTGTVGKTEAATGNVFTTEAGDATTFNTTGVGKVLPGDRLIVTDGTYHIVRTVLAVSSDTSLTVTEDWPLVTWTHAATLDWRIERTLHDQVVDASFVAVNGNSVSIDGGVTLVVTGQGAKTISYAKVYIEYRALRQDLTDLDTVDKTADVTVKIGRLDARNPLAVGVFVARQNTTSIVQFIGITSNNLAGHTKAKDSITPRADIYAIVPLTTDIPTLAMWDLDCTGLAEADEIKGRPQRFRAVIGAGTLATTKDVFEASSTGQSESVTGTAPTKLVRVTLAGETLMAAGVIPGDIITFSASENALKIANGAYTIASVVSETILEIDPSTPFAGVGATTAKYIVHEADGVTERIPLVDPAVATTVAAGDVLFLQLRDAAGTFISSGVAAGDIVQLPADYSTDFTGNLVSLVVASVLSEQRLLIVNNGQDTSTTQNELPHGAKRAPLIVDDPVVAAPTTATLNYKIIRNMSKDQQVSNLIAVAQSFNSRRTVMVWPDRVDVAGVTGGTSQPGYYLSCAVGGMTAGLPPHQGFTYLGIAGVSRIYRSNTYFSDAQLTDLSAVAGTCSRSRPRPRCPTPSTN